MRDQGFAGFAWTEEAPAHVAEVLELARARSLRMVAIYVSATLTTNGFAVGPQAEALLPVLKGSDALVWLHIGTKDFLRDRPAGDAVALEGLRRFAAAAASNGLRVAIYPHRGDWTERFADALRVAKAVDRPNFGATFNLCHALMSGEEADIPRLLGEAGAKLFTVTINGADAGAANTSWGRLIRPLGEGTFDVGPVLGRLREVGYGGAVGLQGFGLRQPYREHLAQSMAAWKSGALVGWTELPFAGDLGAWRAPHGHWMIAGGAALVETNRHLLAPQPGAGVLVNGPAGREPDLCTAAEYGDLELHVEFLVGEKSNSGVYLMGRYEVQVYDSFGVAKDAYPGIECGGIYPRWEGGKNVDGHSPQVNAAKPAGEWQAYDITFRAPRFDAAGKKTANAAFVKVLHNGVVVQENIDVPGPTRGGYAGEAARGPLRLQGDHGPVAYRNVRLRAVSPATILSP